MLKVTIGFLFLCSKAVGFIAQEQVADQSSVGFGLIHHGSIRSPARWRPHHTGDLSSSEPNQSFKEVRCSGSIDRWWDSGTETGRRGVSSVTRTFDTVSEVASPNTVKSDVVLTAALPQLIAALEETLGDDTYCTVAKELFCVGTQAGNFIVSCPPGQVDHCPWERVEGVAGPTSIEHIPLPSFAYSKIDGLSLSMLGHGRLSSSPSAVRLFLTVKFTSMIGSVRAKGQDLPSNGQTLTTSLPCQRPIGRKDDDGCRTPFLGEHEGVNVHSAVANSKHCDAITDEASSGQPQEEALLSRRTDNAVCDTWGKLFVASCFVLLGVLTKLVVERAAPPDDNYTFTVLPDRLGYILSFLSGLVTWRHRRSAARKGGRSKHNTCGGFVTPLHKRSMQVLVSLSLISSLQALSVSDQIVSSTVTWTVADSPVSVTGLVSIASGGTLTVMAGVEVVFETASSGIANEGGTLLIRGKLNSRVKLKPRGNGTWQGISFGPAAVSALFATDPSEIVQFQGGSIVEFTDLLRAGTSTLSALDFDFGTTPYLRDVNVVECDGRSSTPIWINRFEGTFVADFVKVSRETATSTYVPTKWLEVVGVSPDTGFVLIRRLETMSDRDAQLAASNIRTVTVLESTAVGAAVFQNIGTLTLERNKLSTIANAFTVMTYFISVAFVRDNTMSGPAQGNEADVVFAYETGTSSTASVSLDVSGNTLRNGRFKFDCNSCQRNMTITSNTVNDSNSGGFKILSSGRITLRNNTVTNCNSALSSYSTFDLASRAGGNLVCSENKLTRSVAADSLLNLDCDSQSSSCIFQNNVVQDCTATSLVRFINYPWIFQRNLFVNTSAEWSVAISTPSPLTHRDTIVLPANYWGVLQSDVTGPRLTVSDAFVLSRGPIVSFETVLAGPSTTSTLQLVSVPGGLLPDGSVGGLLDGTRSLVLSSGSYTCRLSFILRDAAKIVLSGNVSIAFFDSRGVVLLDDSSLVTTSGSPRLFNASSFLWHGIIVDVNATTSISNVRIQMATDAISHVGAGGLLLDGVNVESAGASCIVSVPTGGVMSGSFMIRRGIFRSCGSNAIHVSNRRSVSVLNTTISKAVGYGIFASSLANLTVRGCTIESTSEHGLHVYDLSYDQPSLQITDNNFTFCGVSLNCYVGCTMFVMRNTILGSMSMMAMSSAVTITSYDSLDVFVQDNIVEAWYITETLAAFDVSFSAKSDPSENAIGLVASRNTFRNISAGNIFSIAYYSTKRATNIGNTFHRNLVATSTSYPALMIVQAWPSDGGGLRPTMQSNMFYEELLEGSDMYYIHLLPEVLQVESIDASRSYWGNVSEATLVDRIYDGNDVTGLSILKYLPVLLTPQSNGPVGPNTSSLGFIRPSGILSGKLGASENITLERGNYTAVGTLIVDGFLTILPGARIMMAPGASLVVRNGSLVVVGSVNDPVLFVSASDESHWGQIKVFPNTTKQQDFRLINVLVTGAGSTSQPAIHTQRVSELRNVFIKDCVGGALLADGKFQKLTINNLRSVNVSSPAGFNVKLAGIGDVAMNNSVLSSFADYELAAFDSVTLSAENLGVYPNSASHFGVYSTNAFTSMRNLSFDASHLNDDGVGHAIHASGGSFELRSSRIVFGSHGVFVSASPTSTYLFIGNTWTGRPTSVRIAEAYGSVSFYNNTFENAKCSSHCFFLTSGPKVEFLGNRVVGVKVLNSQSVFLLSGPEWDVVGNRFESISGYAGIEITSGQSSYTFSRNAWVNVSSLEFLIRTTTLTGSIHGGVYNLPGNFWDGNSFESLQARTYDAKDNPLLAYISYPSMFVDAFMTLLLDAPTTSPCLDPVRKRISCVIRDASTVVVPSGLYYAPRPITLRHPNALLVLEAGARVMFAPGASIRIDKGTFQVRGRSSSPVILTSTSQFYREYGEEGVQNSSFWGGVSFGPNSNPTVIKSDEYVSGSILEGCVIRNAGYLDAPAALSIEGVSVMLRQVSVFESGSHGVQFLSTRTALLVKDTIIAGSAGCGLVLANPTTIATLDTVTVQNSNSWGLRATYHQDLRISSCRFNANRDYQVYSQYGQGTLEVTESTITGMQSYGLWVDSNSRDLRVIVSESICSRTKWPIWIQCREATVSFSNFSINTCVDTGCDSLSILALDNISFIGNTVENNVASRLVHLKTEESSPTPNTVTAVYGNNFLQNRAVTSTSGENAVLALASGGRSLWKVNGNRFMNPASGLDISTFGYLGTAPEDMVVNASGNLFAYPPNANEQEISRRIFDMNDDSNEPLVRFMPFVPANYTPSCLGNCTGHGLCVFPGYCICRPGWGGERCHLPTCQALDFCSGRGQCISFDVCRCDGGWLGASCSNANCTLRNDCNGNGQCTVPNLCSCYDELGYTGQDCNECRADYRLIDASCKKCPPCESGSCNRSAQCDCIGNFAGELCDRCKDGFFGVACQPLPHLVDVVPNDAPDVGGTAVQINGMNLGSTSGLVMCLFGGEPPVNATFVSPNAVQCKTPRVTLLSGSLETTLSLQVGSTQTHNSLPFTFYGLCPSNSCLNGYCTFGRCQCYRGFRGEACSESVVEPLISATPTQPIKIVEGEYFTYSFSLSQGSLPVDFSLTGAPPIGAVMSKDGVLSWENPTASSQTQTLSIMATNELASHEVQLYLDVYPSYRVVIKTATTKVIRPARPFFFDFEALDFAGRRVKDKIAVLWVQRVGSTYRRKTLAKTDKSGTFSRTYLPYANDVGDFVFGGEHPDFENETIQGGFSILGVDVSPSSYYVTGFPSEVATIPNAIAFTFFGGSFTNITVAFDRVDGVQVNAILDRVEVNSTDNIVSMSINLTASEPMMGDVRFVLTTAQGVTTSGALYFEVRSRSPRFEVAPSVISLAVARGGAAVFQNINVRNIGSRNSGVIDIILPKHPVVRSVSGVALSGLAVDESASATFAFTASPELSLGTVFTGTVGFVSSNAFATLQYRVEIVSEVTTALTVVTQDEATFFAEGGPNLAGVLVSVVSRSSGRAVSGITGDNGTIVFANITEDVYEIVAQKLGHKSYRREILLVSPGMTLLAFLQTEVVSYTFTVVPVPIIDRYIIDVTTTFKTNVPIPVVVIEPAQLDWEGIRSGLVDEITITATNYGYIAAENLTFTWPGYWETARFILPNGDRNPSRTRNLGALPANSSVTFSIKVDQKKRFSVPAGRMEVCDPSSNNCYFLPSADDPEWARGDVGFIASPGNNPVAGQMFVKVDANGNFEYIYEFETRNLFDFVYQYNSSVNASELVDVVLTQNASVPSSRQLKSSREAEAENRRELLSIADPQDCFACIGCEVGIGRICGTLDTACTTGRALLGSSAAALLCEPVEDKCSDFECPGCSNVPMNVDWSFTCGTNPIRGSYQWDTPRVFCPSNDPLPPSLPQPIPSDPTYFGDAELTPIQLDGECKLSEEVAPARYLSDIPDHVIPAHRAILQGCPVCPPDVLRLAFRTIKNYEANVTATETAMQRCVETAKSSGGLKSLYPCVMRRGIEFLRFVPLLSKAVECQLSQEPCYRSVELATSPGLANLLIQARRIQSLADLTLLPFGGFIGGDPVALMNSSSPSENEVSSFDSMIIDGVADQSSGGRGISAVELDSLRGIGLSLPSGSDIERFASLWNKSLNLWDQGTFNGNATSLYFNLDDASALMSKFQASRSAVRQEGFSGLADAWLSAVEGQQFEEARKLAGICAAVRVKIEQELTLTRTGFEARLEISNNGDYRLDNVSVVLRASPFGNASFDATQLFVFGDPTLNQVTAVDGTGAMDPNRVGSATWLVIPLSEAAPVFETKYDISGILLYSIQGIKYEQYFAPSTISVVPDPQLHLTYFHSRVAYANDPFTSGVVEPSVPFHLGLLIDNRGYGEARNVEMVSSQPEIVENSKGLLVNFNIIGARLGNQPLSKSLKIDFGTIGPKTKSLGVWDLVSTLRGEFFNFSATFRYKGPIDDKRLSLIDSVEIFELTHLVRVTGEHPAMPQGGLGYYDDELDDFLVNRLPDAYYLPDTVFTSDSRGSNYSVGTVRNRGWSETPIENLFDGSLTVVVRHNLTRAQRGLLPDWVYLRFDDRMARTDYILQSVTRPDVNYTLIPQYNSWQTSWTTYLSDGTIVYEDFVHLFDFGVSDTYVLRYTKQQPVTGLEVTARSNHSLTVAWVPAAGGTASYVLYKPSSLTNDSYYKVAEEYLQINSCEISGLASGTNYTIQVFTGADSGTFERTGARISGLTLGTSKCGNAVLDTGEECDAGLSNGSPGSNCTNACYLKVLGSPRIGIPTQKPGAPNPAKVPTRRPVSRAPSRSPSRKPSPKPTRFPTKSPTRPPTRMPTPKPTMFPTKRPVTRAPSRSPTPQCRTSSQSCSTVATSTLKCCQGLTCRASTSGGALRCVTCLAVGKTCGTTTSPCCDGLKCNSSTKRCVACKAKGSTCTSTAQCCGSLTCSTTTKKCA